MTSPHIIERVRHELVSRRVTVSSVEPLTPRVLRIDFESPELEGFHSPAADDHIAIFFPSDEAPDGESKRHYTPRAFAPGVRRLTIDFVLHQAGPASDWARQASPGEELWIGGPKSSLVVSDDFAWYLLIGDETAWPAIARRLEALPRDAVAFSVVTLFDERERQRIETAARWTARWLERGEASPSDAALVQEALAALELPPGDGFIWIAGEAALVKTLRAHFVERGHPRAWIHAAAYWKFGHADVHEVVEDC